jgi:hypothetical protein
MLLHPSRPRASGRDFQDPLKVIYGINEFPLLPLSGLSPGASTSECARSMPGDQ